jgi:hypothetical protein
MKRFPIAAVVSLGVAAALLAPTAGSTQTPAPQYFVLHQEKARPSMVKEYESTTKEFITLVKANKAKMPHFSFNAFVSPDFTYSYVSPIPNLAGLDAINADFGALAQAAGAALSDLNKRGGVAMERVDEAIIQRLPEQSYAPAEPRLESGRVRYYHYGFYYVIPGREGEVDALGQEYLKLFKAKGVKNGYTIYKGVMGADLPYYFVSEGALDAADFQVEDAKTAALVGPELEALGARLMALTRRYETREAVPRPDLSLPR